MYNKSTKTSNFKRSGYILALIEYSDIQRLNGHPILDDEIYNLPRKPTDETESLICIRCNIFLKMLEHVKEEKGCDYLSKIREYKEFSFIKDIDKLDMKYSFIINRIVLHLIEEGWNENYILLNIEPRGFGKLEKAYPTPLITIPG